MQGQIVQKPNGTFMVRIYLGPNPKTGKKKYLNKVFKTKKEAEKARNEMLVQKDKGLLRFESSQTLNQYLDQWLEESVKMNVRPRTYDDYEANLNRYIRPVLGKRPLEKLKPLEIQALYNDMTKKGLSPRTVRYAHSVLRGALNQAVTWQLIADNPSNRVSLPRQKKKEMSAFTPDEARRFLKATATDKWGILFALLLATGMRPGEILALRWKDIDLEKGIVTVNRALSKTKQGLLFDEPKTSRSRRSIPLPNESKESLVAYRQQQREKLFAKGGHRLKEDDLVFANDDGSPLAYRNLERHHFKVILRTANLSEKIRLYDLRHSHATLLLADGINPKVVAERLGHSTVTLTLDTYSHVLPDMQREAAKKLEKSLFA